MNKKMKSIHTQLFVAAAYLVLATGCSPRQTEQLPSASKPPRDDFEKKLKCAGMLEKLREAAEIDQFKIEAYARSFYSPRLNACLAEKYTIYGSRNKVPEAMEIVNLSSNETVWFARVECKVRPVGLQDKPKMEYGCTDYAWNVEGQIEDYVKANRLEEEQE